MVAQEQTTESSATPAAASPSRLRRWAARRARQLLWAVAIMAVTLFVTTAGVLVWRWSGLIGLPDIGDPFDVDAFRAFRIAEDQDAMVLYREAEAKLSQMPVLPLNVRRAQRKGAIGWSKADPKMRDSALANREALDLFRRTAEQPDAMVHPPEQWRGGRLSSFNVSSFSNLTLLEGSRLEEQGDMAGAWSRYRSLLLLKMHIMRRASIFQRFITDMVTGELNACITSWAADRRTGVSLLRQALADVLAQEPKPEWDGFSLKIDYMDMMGELSRPDGWLQTGMEHELDFRIGDEKLPPNLAGNLYQARRFLLNEPERSRRVLRLAFANWLAHAARTSMSNDKPVLIATFYTDRLNTSPLYANNSNASGSQSLPLEKVAEWLLTTHDAKMLLHQRAWPGIRVSEKRHHADLVILLAEELYRRDHGAPPASASELVGPYVDHLPDDGSSELDDGSPKRVVEQKGPMPTGLP